MCIRDRFGHFRAVDMTVGGKDVDNFQVEFPAYFKVGLITVSYTPLDVYKRQPPYRRRRRLFHPRPRLEEPEDARTDGQCQAHGAEPVSYTHLDVYKRQLSPMAFWRMSLPRC